MAQPIHHRPTRPSIQTVAQIDNLLREDGNYNRGGRAVHNGSKDTSITTIAKRGTSVPPISRKAMLRRVQRLEYDNISAVAREMLNWRTNPHARKPPKPGFPLTIKYDGFAQITSIKGDWFSPWCKNSPMNSSGTLLIYRSTSEKIISLINPRDQPQPRSKATEDLEWTHLEEGQLWEL